MKDLGNPIKELFPVRSDKGNKGTFGNLLIVAGSEYMTGALVMVVTSALHSGVGLVRAFSTKEALMPVKISCPCALLSAYEEENVLRKTEKLLGKTTAAVIGPGLDTKDPRNKDILMYLIDNCKSLIIDASALTILASLNCYGLDKRREKGLEPAILTPHVGEFKRFGVPSVDFDNLEDKALLKMTKDFASSHDVILVLKNHNTLVTTPDGKCYYNYGDNSGMAKGGSGDVLAGLMGGFLASGFTPVNAANCAVYVHSMAGRLAAEDKTKLFMLPMDVIEKFPQVYKELGW